MSKLTAEQTRFQLNATLIAAYRLIFSTLEENTATLQLLGDVAETSSGGTPDRGRADYYGGEVPWIKSGELEDGLITDAQEFITEQGLENSSAKIFPKGTLVVALYGATVGKTGILGLNAATNQAVCAVTSRIKEITRDYLYWFLRNKRIDFLRSSFGGAQPNISQRLLRETPLPVPSPELQKAICRFLEAVEERQNANVDTSLPELPSPLSSVGRIVARIEQLAAQIEEARQLRHQATEEVRALSASASDVAFRPRRGWREARVSDFCETPQYGFTESATTEAVGPRFLRITDIQDGHVNWGTVPFCLCPNPEPYLLKPKEVLCAVKGIFLGVVDMGDSPSGGLQLQNPGAVLGLVTCV